MKTLITAIVVGILTNCCQAVKVLQYDLFKDSQTSSALRHRSLSTRAEGNKTISQEVLNQLKDYSYHISVKVGTPPQDILLVLATSSQRTVLVAKDGTCSRSATICTTPLDRDASSTYELTDEDGFSITFVKGEATGDVIKDKFILGSSPSPISLTVGLANSFNYDFISGESGVGVLGIGYSEDPNDPSTDNSVPNRYNKVPNIVDQLVANNVINTRLYSVWLNDLQSPAGNVLFGGIDTSKFIGNLTSVPLRDGPDGYGSSTILLKSLSIVDGESKTPIETNSSGGGGAEPVALDTGTTWTFLPDVAVQKIYKLLGATIRGDAALLDCNMSAKSDAYIAFEFENGQVIRVYYSQLIVKVDSNSFSYSDLPFKEVCWLGIYPNTNTRGYSILGHSFLRSAYVVYDVDNNRIGIAQSNLKSSTSDVHEVAAGDNNIPRVSLGPARAATASVVQQTSSRTASASIGTSVSNTRSQSIPTTGATGSTATASATAQSGVKAVRYNLVTHVIFTLGAAVGGWGVLL